MRTKNIISNYLKLSNETVDINLMSSNSTSIFSIINTTNKNYKSSLSSSFVLSSALIQNKLSNSLALPPYSSSSKNKTIQFFNPITHSKLTIPLIISAESSSRSLSQSPSNSSASQGSFTSSKILPSYVVVSKSFERPVFLKNQCIEIHKLDSGAYSAIG